MAAVLWKIGKHKTLLISDNLFNLHSCECKPCNHFNCPFGKPKILKAVGNDQPRTCCNVYQCSDSYAANNFPSNCGDLDGAVRQLQEEWYTNECTICTCQKDGRVTCVDYECTRFNCKTMTDRQYNFAKCCERECNQYFPDFRHDNFDVFNFMIDENGCKKVLGCHDEGCQITLDPSGCGICDCSNDMYVTSRPEIGNYQNFCPSLLSCRRQCKKFGRQRDPNNGCEVCKCRQGPLTCPSLHDCFKKKSKLIYHIFIYHHICLQYVHMATDKINTDVKCVNVAVAHHLIVSSEDKTER